MRWIGNVTGMWKEANAYRGLAGTTNKDHLEENRRWVDNIKVDLQDTELKGANLINLVQDMEKLWDFEHEMNFRA
jgi:hypothetical protein